MVDFDGIWISDKMTMLFIQETPKMNSLRDYYERALQEFGTTDDGELKCLEGWNGKSKNAPSKIRCKYLPGEWKYWDWILHKALKWRSEEVPLKCPCASLQLDLVAYFFYFFLSSRSVAAVHPGGTGTLWKPRKLWQDPLESHEVSGRRECGEIHLQVYTAADWTPISRWCKACKFRCQQPTFNNCIDVHQLQEYQAGVPLGVMAAHELFQWLQVETEYCSSWSLQSILLRWFWQRSLRCS